LAPRRGKKQTEEACIISKQAEEADRRSKYKKQKPQEQQKEKKEEEVRNGGITMGDGACPWRLVRPG
jgi:hypothetical protein